MEGIDICNLLGKKGLAHVFISLLLYAFISELDFED